jgi:hypothetical protein
MSGGPVEKDDGKRGAQADAAEREIALAQKRHLRAVCEV